MKSADSPTRVSDTALYDFSNVVHLCQIEGINERIHFAKKPARRRTSVTRLAPIMRGILHAVANGAAEDVHCHEPNRTIRLNAKICDRVLAPAKVTLSAQTAA